MMVSVANVLVVVVCSAALAGVQGQVVHYGQCPDLPTQSAFNPARVTIHPRSVLGHASILKPLNSYSIARRAVLFFA